METRVLKHVKTFEVHKEDETGLIPRGVVLAEVNYAPDGKASYVYFYGDVNIKSELGEDPSPEHETYLNQISDAEKKVNERLNHPRSRKEYDQIANRLEASLTH